MGVDECVKYNIIIEQMVDGIIYWGTGTVGMTPFPVIFSLLLLALGDAGVLSSRNSGFFTSISPA